MRALQPLLLCVVLACACGPACSEDAPAKPKKKPVTENRLAKERSPYLRQHRTNPVDWWPWGEEAFALARKEDKPIFLSVGYAACHWCHVMEHESFEDEATAKLMNEVFVCVKVDREERPDVDRVYMSFVQMRTGRGGWPMTVFMTPEGKPFWGGTYLPRDSLQKIVGNVQRVWKEQRAEIEQSAAAYVEQIAAMSDGPDLPASDDSDAEVLKTLRNALTVRFDRRYGGYGTRPKFPPHTELLFFLDAGGRRMEPDDRTQVLATLDAMARGGIHDHVGGGFHRYSTDERWLLPHFEKMLYDNALLAQAYAGAYALTGEPRYRRVVERLFAWLEREMKRPGGGYASSLDADTEGEEGLTYTWSWEELQDALVHEDVLLLAPVFGLSPSGNFHDEATGAPAGRNILHMPEPLPAAAKVRGMPTAKLRTLVDGKLGDLLAVRAKRAQPGLDDKVITGWNGLLLSAFARAGRDLDSQPLLDRGKALAAFLLERCRTEDGGLLRFPAGSGPEIPGFCEDHVHLIEGLLDLAEVTGEATWSDAAGELAVRLNAEFQDEARGGFFTTSAARHETLIARSKETWDSPIPSDNGTAARLNLRLAALTGDAAFRRAADRTLAAFRPLMATPRMAPGLVALIRALSDRADLAARGAMKAVRGDVHVQRGVAQVDAFLERAQARPGTKVELVIRITLAEGWHVNAHAPSREELIATTLGQAPKAVAALTDVRYPRAVTRDVGGSALALYEGAFEIRAALVVPADAPPGPRKVRLLLGWQPCDADSCQAPVELALDLPLRFDAQDGPRQHPSLFE